MLAGDCQWLAIFLSIIEQASLIGFEDSFRNISTAWDSISSAAFQEQAEVNTPNSESALGKASHCEVL